MRRFFSFFFLFVLTVLVKAQVTGIVVDSRSRQPLDFVNVYYEGKNVGDQTDETGHFALKEIPHGTSSLSRPWGISLRRFGW